MRRPRSSLSPSLFIQTHSQFFINKNRRVSNTKAVSLAYIGFQMENCTEHKRSAPIINTLKPIMCEQEEQWKSEQDEKIKKTKIENHIFESCFQIQFFRHRAVDQLEVFSPTVNIALCVLFFCRRNFTKVQWNSCGKVLILFALKEVKFYVRSFKVVQLLWKKGKVLRENAWNRALAGWPMRKPDRCKGKRLHSIDSIHLQEGRAASFNRRLAFSLKEISRASPTIFFLLCPVRRLLFQHDWT